MNWYYYKKVYRERKDLTKKYLDEMNLMEKFGAIFLMFIVQHQILQDGIELINDKGETKIISKKI